MNSDASAHEIPGVGSLYIDAFSKHYLSSRNTASSSFILTHYHGDHYGSLPRDYQYVGPAPIHCTRITARLLRKIHRVSDDYIVEHEYSETWTHSWNNNNKEDEEEDTAQTNDSSKASSSTRSSSSCQITFYDANHCPGAAIVVVELLDHKVHVHTGDFRYCPQATMLPSYDCPRLTLAAKERRIDTVWLDTTYAHPKHTFDDQDVVVERIASQVQEQLRQSTATDDHTKTLILLECYNIGKEKILWAVANRCQQPLYVTQRKWDLLECLLESDGDPTEDGSNNSSHCHHQVLRHCTQDASSTNLHVVPMGTAGTMWPFFQPNYESIAEYVEQLQQSQAYTKVVAFIPTGWAGASNWNQKHATTQLTRRNLEIEIRLVAYSEHSSFQELQAFVKFTCPVKVIATVYKDAKDKRLIEARFPVDRNRAKKRFLDQLVGGSQQQVPAPTRRPTSMSSVAQRQADDCGLAVSTPRSARTESSVAADNKTEDNHLARLVDMGFAPAVARRALAASNQDIEAAIQHLLHGGVSDKERNVSSGDRRSQSSPSSALKVKTPTKLTSYFKRKATTPG
jgi:DNA cross-link repair 1A protein